MEENYKLHKSNEQQVTGIILRIGNFMRFVFPLYPLRSPKKGVLGGTGKNPITSRVWVVKNGGCSPCTLYAHKVPPPSDIPNLVKGYDFWGCRGNRHLKRGVKLLNIKDKKAFPLRALNRRQAHHPKQKRKILPIRSLLRFPTLCTGVRNG